MSQQILVNLSKAEKKALRILAAIEEQSMGEFTRESIRAKWSVYYPDYPLGDLPKGHKNVSKEVEEKDEA